MFSQGLSTDRKSMNENKFLSLCPGLKAEKRKRERKKERESKLYFISYIKSSEYYKKNLITLIFFLI